MLLSVPATASAQVIISELLWMGSDQSTADEWIEFVNTSDETIDLSGWSVLYKNSGNQEVTMFTFGQYFIEPGQFFLVSNYNAANSRLAIEPDLVTTAVSLPNTNLFLKLLNASGAVIDEVDDGEGSPFAGVNTSGAPKRSMERVDFLASGRARENWQSADDSVNFDEGSLIFGTPGAENSDGLVVPSSSSSSSSSSSAPTYDGANIILISILPNPDGADTGAEKLEFLNHSSYATKLDGWRLVTETTTKKSYKLSGSIGPNGRLTVYSSESKFTLPNGEATVTLVDPLGGERSVFTWTTAEEGRTYYPDLGDIEMSGTVQAVLHAHTFVMQASPSVRQKAGIETVLVRLLGVDVVEGTEETDAAFQMSGFDWLHALVQKRSVTLEFGPELWSREGELFVYAYTDGRVNLAEDGLLKGYLRINALDHPWKERYRELEETAKREKRGLWEYVTVKKTSSSSSSSASASQKKIPVIADPTLYDGLLISEVYPSPFPASQAQENSEPLLSEEWIELQNSGPETLNLSGWLLTVGSKTVSLPASALLPPDTFHLLETKTLKMQLKNSGNVVVLSSPDASVVREIVYPNVKHGYAYALDVEVGEYCLSTHPTPMSTNLCTEPVPVDRSAAAKKAVATRKANTIAGYVGLYDADVAAAMGTGTRIVSPAEGSGVSVFSLILSAVFGLGGGLIGRWVVARK